MNDESALSPEPLPRKAKQGRKRNVTHSKFLKFNKFVGAYITPACVGKKTGN